MPQGSILGPLLFLLYVNDIVKNIGSNIRLFADDTSLFIIVDNPTTAGLCLNSDLENLSRWAAIWLVTFNPSKNESLLISCKINKSIHPPLYMQNVQIQEDSSHKHLGLYFSNLAAGNNILIILSRKLGSEFILCTNSNSGWIASLLKLFI